MKLPYIKIKQKNEIFFVVRFKVEELVNRINFHFREPYSNDAKGNLNYSDYIEKIKKRGIEITADDEGIQRRLEYSRILKIKEYLETSEDSFFPTSIVLSVDVSEDENFNKKYEEIESNDYGLIEISDELRFQIVDGQHRLAGLYLSSKEVQEEFEISAVLLFNATINTCAKMFSDINGNQQKVNKSVLYDLYSLIEADSKEDILNKKLHQIAVKLNNDPESPLYKHLKMLGIGYGAISQAFFIQYFKGAVTSLNWINKDTQFIYDNIFLYLKSFQIVFSSYWPVLEKEKYANSREFYDYSRNLLKVEKSQIMKTNGFGSIILLMPEVIKRLNDLSFNDYFREIIKLKGKIDWINDSEMIQGTGKKIQDKIMKKMIKYIEN